MDKYTYDNIIINPNKEGIESLIGKEVYFHINPNLCLDNANEGSSENSGILEEINAPSAHPFKVRKKSGTVYSYPCIIPKNEVSKPKYVPFKNVKEFVERYTEIVKKTESDSFNGDLFQFGMWVKERGHENDVYCMISEMWNDGVVLGSDQLTTHWAGLLDDYMFLDDTLCGKPKEENND